MSPPSLSIVIPVFNEEREMPVILRAATSLLDELGREGEVLVLDNASIDRTPSIVAGTDDARVRLLRNDTNRGKGFSIRRGMLEARADLRLMCDADCTPSLSSLPRMLELIEDADVVVGSRVARGAHVGRAQPLLRRLVGLGFLVLTRLLLGRLTRDVYCGFKLWRADAAERVFRRVELDGWVFDAEALALARLFGLRVREAGITWVNRPSSRLAVADVLVPAVRELVRARRHVRAESARLSAEQAHSPAASRVQARS